MNLNFIKYASVLLDAGPDIKDKIQENYNFLAELYGRMMERDEEQTATAQVQTEFDVEFAVANFPSVAALCQSCEPARVASGTVRKPNGFLSDLIGNFRTIEDIQNAIHLIITIAKLFGVDLNLSE